MKTKVGIAIYQLIALFNSCGRPSENLTFIKETLRHLQIKTLSLSMVQQWNTVSSAHLDIWCGPSA